MKKDVYRKVGTKLCKVTVCLECMDLSFTGVATATIATMFDSCDDAIGYAEMVCGRTTINRLQDGNYVIKEIAGFATVKLAKEWIGACFVCDKASAETTLSSLEGARK